MRPAIMFPGDVLLYRGAGDILGQVIDWAEWIDGHENTAYCHAAMYYGSRFSADPEEAGLWIVRQNPGGPAFEDVEAQKWENIDVFRPIKDDKFLSSMPGWVEAWEALVKDHFKDSYGYQEIVDYLGEDLLARIGLGKQSEELREKAAAFLSQHVNVCSEWIRICINEATRKALALPDFDLLSGLQHGVGLGQARPADLVLSPFLRRVSA